MMICKCPGLTLFLLTALLPNAFAASPQVLAPTPPMGWNSYDSFGTTIKEADLKANALWMARHLKRFGWQYVVVDMEWFVTNPTPAGNGKDSQYSMDEFGRYTPAPNRFPSAANSAGFKPLADYAHSLGLKFGIHILKGIPRRAVDQNLPIAGSSFHAADAADLTDTCPWNPDNYGLDPQKPAAQAYYDSIAQLYDAWGVDFIKADCIASRPYDGDEIRLLSHALGKQSHPILLSLSPGEAPIDKAEELQTYPQMWRISDDIWDMWHSTVFYPQGLGDQFVRAAKWAPLAKPGHWPDADMMTLGSLKPAPGWGQPRQTQFTREEQRTLVTLWSIFCSPLMMGGNLTQNDAWTTSLLTNRDVLTVDQDSEDSHQVIATDSLVVWMSRPKTGSGWNLAVFNIGETPASAKYAWKDIGLPEGKLKVRDLWQRKDLGAASSLSVTLRPHSSVLYRVAGSKSK